MRLKSILLEIGRAKPYEFKQTKLRKKIVYPDPDLSYKPDEKKYKGLAASYEFETDEGTSYQVILESLGTRRDEEHTLIKVDFKSLDHNKYWERPDPMTGEYDVVKIVTTVLEVAADLYNELNEKIDGFVFTGSLKDEDKSSLDSKRSRVYKELIKKRFPQADISKYQQKFTSDEYYLVKLD